MMARLIPRFAFVIPVLLFVEPSALAGQVDATRDSGRVLILECQLSADSMIDTAIAIALERRVVYWIDVTGAGTPVAWPTRRGGREAFVVPIATDASGGTFELYPRTAGTHRIVLTGVRNGEPLTIRLYRDVVETQRIEERRERDLHVSLVVGGGVHSGFRLDPTGGENPAGGLDLETGLLAETGSFLGTWVGYTRQSFPDAGFDASWVFIEERARAFTARPWSGRRTDLYVALRIARALDAGPRHQSPDWLGVGLYVVQHLSSQGHRRGWAFFASAFRGRLGNTIETEWLHTNRLTAGASWHP